jgi:hypothetical protein
VFYAYRDKKVVGVFVRFLRRFISVQFMMAQESFQS